MRRARSWNLTFAQLLAFAAVVAPIVASLRFPISTIDLAYLIRAGEMTIDTGDIVRTDPFTFAAYGQPWLNQQWGAEIFFALVHRAGGWELIAMVRAALAALTMWLLFLACRGGGASVRRAAWLSLASLLIALHGLPARPQLLGFTLFALTLWILAERRTRPWALWLLPAAMIAWANVHGSFPLMLLLVVLAWLEDRGKDPMTARSLLRVAVAIVVASLLNPYGVHVWRYVVELSSDPELRRTILEWRPPSLKTGTGVLFYLSGSAVLFLVLRVRHRVPWPRQVGLLLFFVMGATAVRGIIWWALAAPVMIADLFPGSRARQVDDAPRAINTVFASALVALAILLLPWFRPTFASTANPATVTDGLLAHSPVRFSDRVLETVEPGSRMFVPQLWASWFEFAVPGNPVMVDPRIELFTHETWRDYDLVSSAAPGWAEVLERWDVDVLVLSWEQQRDLIVAIDGHPSWRPVLEDPDGLLLVRTR